MTKVLFFIFSSLFINLASLALDNDGKKNRIETDIYRVCHLPTEVLEGGAAAAGTFLSSRIQTSHVKDIIKNIHKQDSIDLLEVLSQSYGHQSCDLLILLF